MNVSALEADFLVMAQPAAGDLPELAANGVRRILCLRPDDEEGDYPSASTLAIEARRLGMIFDEAPVRGLEVTQTALDAVDAALGSGERTVAYCRSGRRAVLAWALARRRSGMPTDDVLRAAAAIGHDLDGSRSAIEGAGAAD